MKVKVTLYWNQYKLRASYNQVLNNNTVLDGFKCDIYM